MTTKLQAITLVVGVVWGVFCRVAEAQPPGQTAPAAGDRGTTLSRADPQALRAALEGWAAQSEQLLSLTPLGGLQYLLDRALVGDELPAPLRPAFSASFAPAKEKIRQFLEQQFQSPQLRSPAAGTLARWGVVAQLAQFQAGPGAGGGVQASGDLGNGMNAQFSGNQLADTETTVAEGGRVDLDVSRSIATAKGSIGIGFADGARVDRCPSADGVDPGKSDIEGSFGATVSLSEGTSGSGGFAIAEHMTAEAHVGDDALIRDVRLQFNIGVTQRSDSSVLTTDIAGTGNWDPHTYDEPSIRITRCSASDGAPVSQDTCDRIGRALTLSPLRKAYLRAEKQWNFSLVDQYGNPGKSSKCVTVEFKPKSKTVRGKPSQTISIEAQLLTVDGRHPTTGTFDELVPVIGGDIQQNGARAAPGAPARLTYKAPDQPWAQGSPPGFDVVEAKSRAGAFKGVFDNHAKPEEYEWLLKPGLKLTIHDRWENRTPYGSLLSEATFPIELTMAADGSLTGQATVARTDQQVESPIVIICTETGQWTETWQAFAVYDDSGANLTVRLKYRSSDREGLAVCPSAPPKRYTDPGVSSEGVSTPLDHFTLPAEEGATKQFVFALGAFSKTTIDVTVAPADAEAH